jgi:hypothetical protein
MTNLNQLQQTLDTSDKLHEFSAHYNWDDGFEIPTWIINNPLCDRGTALMMYWLAEPHYFCQYTTRDEVKREWELENYGFIQEVEEKYINGFYKIRKILFNPRHDMSNGMLGHDWTQVNSKRPQRREIPPEMFEPSIQDTKWEKAGKPIEPTRKINYDGFKPIREWLEKLKDEGSDENSV